MDYTNKLKNKGINIEINKTNVDDKGYDLHIYLSKGDDYYEAFFSMSNSKGYYFTFDETDCRNDGCNWKIDSKKLISEYIGVENLLEID